MNDAKKLAPFFVIISRPTNFRQLKKNIYFGVPIRMKKVALIIHGHRSLSKSSSEVIRLLMAEPDLKVTQYKTTCIGDAIQLAQKACLDSHIIVAVGGDGTCNEVINGIITSGASREVQFGIIPNGTGNDFVRNLETFSPMKFVEKLKDGTGKQIDLGRVSFESAKRYFLNVADIGFGAKVVETMDRQRKKGIKGKASYSLAILRTFFSYKKTEMKLTGDGIEFKGKSLMLVFSNGTTFGHGLQIFPEAEIDNGKLGLTIIGDVSLFQYVKNLSNLKKGRKIDHPEVQYHQFVQLKISTGSEIHVEMDGEIAGCSALQIEVIPKALFLLC